MVLMENILRVRFNSFWKSLWEISEFKQDYTGDIVSADGDATSDQGSGLPNCLWSDSKSRSQFIKSWDKMMKN